MLKHDEFDFFALCVFILVCMSVAQRQRKTKGSSQKNQSTNERNKSVFALFTTTLMFAKCYTQN